ncbi:MAG: glycosyltransferase [Sedimentisphaerales bacterium]|nr:glycosyltransferase [Sedimentisphaerales bacterium]HNY79001.1 glycosyltransferase [Sedimentisphaerales bacterium]HOC64050.1 glycosyltransferase [Sedimentisphaerales bacterium]HOH64915.1 glycosyltransferase [Sedimentisphaerales bacterium]HPY51530.1 glycosyltransferase [Sedimentisphaerales bacterium]
MANIRGYIPERVKELARRLRAVILSLDLRTARIPELSERERMASGDFSVIVPIHDAPEVTARCLSSIGRYGGDAEVILVDDGSRQERTVKLIQQTVEEMSWKLIRHDTPLRHSRACEAGGRLATRKYLLFLNSDAILTPWTWCGAWDAFAADPGIALVGPSTSLGTFQVAAPRARHCARYWTNEQVSAFAQKYVRRQPPDALVEVSDLVGFALYIRREVWEQCGGFHPDLPDYGNENELCKRLRRDGARIGWTRASYVHHIGACSIRHVITAQEKLRRHEAARRFIDQLYPEEQVQWSDSGRPRADGARLVAPAQMTYVSCRRSAGGPEAVR